MSTGLRQWKMESRVEPTVRIGVVMVEDEMKSIEMRLDNEARDTVLVRLDGDALLVKVSAAAEQRVETWSYTPKKTSTPAKGDGVVVKGVVAGRGFHWQKNVDQT